ncbi:MAG TPA: M6 family metalloprotease domain-containing protein [Gemmatimonadales bacterium]|jgi:M6 family metalloprotease-like protein|nr:M6 family metalloprotease domain-containing protein [Gemmatimonadales bacterium]
MHPRWEIPGFDFAPDGVWRGRARRIAQRRATLFSQRAFSQLNEALALAAPGPAPSAAAVTGVLKVPAIFMRFGDTNVPALYDTAAYAAVLFGTTPPSGRPYTIRTFYEQMSHGLFSMQGQVLGWAALTRPEASYTGGTNCSGNPFGTTNCNGIFSTAAIDALQTGMREALAKLDSLGVDWGQFDNDGPDGIPNSGDDDGYVDMAIFVHPNIDGACGGNNNVWSHRYVLVNQSQTAESSFVTSTPWAGHPGQFIKVRDYTIQSGVGGGQGCDGSQIMPIGTAAHESGHGLDLPDLYDIRFATEGAGQWGLMGSGNWTDPFSPSRMEAWSLSQLGWVTVAPLTTSGTYSIGPAEGPLPESTYVVRVQGANPRGEYFLLENREAVGADTAMIHYHCEVWYQSYNPPPSCGGGLLIWHVDSLQIANNGFHVSNLVNDGPIHGVALEQADGLGNLDASPSLSCRGSTPHLGCSDRGDAGDPYPGVTGNTSFSFLTNPAATKNADSSFVGFAIDSIHLLAPGGAVAFRLRIGGVTTVQVGCWGFVCYDTNVVVLVDNVPYQTFRNVFDSGSVHQIAVAATQDSRDGRTRYSYVSWSDGGARAHSITGTLAGKTYVATLAHAFRLDYTATAGGTVTASPTAVTSGAYVAENSTVTLTAAASPGAVFAGWTGDTTTRSPSLSLPMQRPYRITASFVAPLATADVVAQLLTGTSRLTPADLSALDVLGNNNGRFDVGDFLAWVKATGAPLTTAQRALVHALEAPGAPR